MGKAQYFSIKLDPYLSDVKERSSPDFLFFQGLADSAFLSVARWSESVGIQTTDLVLFSTLLLLSDNHGNGI